MSGLTITTIIDKKAKSIKLINNRPGYDMKYIKSYIYKLMIINNSSINSLRLKDNMILYL